LVPLTKAVIVVPAATPVPAMIWPTAIGVVPETLETDRTLPAAPGVPLLMLPTKLAIWPLLMLPV
jgi:hypothetical protein